MTERKNSVGNDEWPISNLDTLVAIVKRIQRRALDEGRTTVSTPNIDEYIRQRQRAAGSPENRQL